MKNLMLVVVLTGMILVQGCGPMMVIPTIETSRSYETVSYDEVWSATVKTFALRSYPIQVIEKDSGILTTSIMSDTSAAWGSQKLDSLVTNPNIPLAIWTNMSTRITAYVQKDPVQVKIITRIKRYESNFTQAWHLCYSNGIIERSILNSIESDLAK